MARTLFPDSTTQGPAPRKLAPFTQSVTTPVNQVDIETVTATGGTRTYTVNGLTTAAVAYNASAATIKAAIEAITGTVEPVTVTGSVGVYNLYFDRRIVGDNPTVTTTPSLTGGTNTATVTKTTTGTYLIRLGAGNTGGTFTITVNGVTTAAIAYNATEDAVEAAITTALSSLVNSVTVTQTGTYVNTFTWSGIFKNQTVAFSVNTASLTGGTSVITNRAPSMSGITSRQSTQEALASQGFARGEGQVNNDIDVLSIRTPKDIGDPLRIPGEK